MFNLANTNLNMFDFLLALRSAVRKERDALKEKARNQSVSCSLHHTVTFKADGPEEVATLQYSMADIDRDGIKPAQYLTTDLKDGENYQLDYLSPLIDAAAQETNASIDMAAFNNEVMYTDDITESVNNFITSYLRSINIEDGFTVRTAAVAGGIASITIVVA